MCSCTEEGARASYHSDTPFWSSDFQDILPCLCPLRLTMWQRFVSNWQPNFRGMMINYAFPISKSTHFFHPSAYMFGGSGGNCELEVNHMAVGQTGWYPCLKGTVSVLLNLSTVIWLIFNNMWTEVASVS